MKPLSGLTVLDFSRVLAGPLATQILAELGATVIKIESPTMGDESRTWEPILPMGESAYFFAFNRGKRSVTLNLKTKEGRQIAKSLAARADILVENFLPRAMDRLGLGYDELSAVNPRLVYVSNSGFGQTGPYRDRKGYDTIFQALSGVMSLTGPTGGQPAKVGLPFADLTSGLWIAIACLAGIVGRAANGKGCHVDLSMMDVQVSLLTIAAARVFAFDEEPVRMGTEHPGRVPSAAFECADGGWLHISGSDQHWSALCDVLGLVDLKDGRLETNSARVQNRDLIMDSMRRAIASRKRDELAAQLRAADVPAGEVNSLREVLSDPHTLAREMVQHFDHPLEGRFPALRTPAKFSGYDDTGVQLPPLLGADTDSVLFDFLGITPSAIAELRDTKVI